MRTLKEIEEEMDKYSDLGDLGKVMDLADEHGNTVDKMYKAIIEGDLEKIKLLEPIGMDITQEHFVKAAIIHEQLLVIAYQVNSGADVDLVIDFAAPRDEPLVSGSLVYSGSPLIWKWAKSWKSANALSKKLPLKGQPHTTSKI